jgi:O-antigen/teichoic acid export membrane protein
MVQSLFSSLLLRVGEGMKQWAAQAVQSVGARQGLIMAAATLLAGGFDYGVNVVIGRMLVPTQFSVFVAVTALLQVVVHVTNVIRNVVAFYTAEATVLPDAPAKISRFLQRRWRWVVRWGLAATAVATLLAPLIARLMRIDSPWPLWAGCLTIFMLFLRPVTDGALQGLQRFLGLGTVQVLQALLRFALAPLLIWFGWEAVGALLSLPLAMAGALLLALWLLRGYFGALPPGAAARPVSWNYSALTLLGLLAFALMVNVDAILVKRLFGPLVAGDYSPVVTLGKINLFIPLGIGLVLFPKATQRHAAGRDARPVLLLALAATLLPGLTITAVYFLIPGLLVQTIFTDAYANPGAVLGLVGLATTLYAGVNIWLNYALSLERRAFVYALALIVLLQVVAMLLFPLTLPIFATIMVSAGLLANLAGAFVLLPMKVDPQTTDSTDSFP